MYVLFMYENVKGKNINLSFKEVPTKKITYIISNKGTYQNSKLSSTVILHGINLINVCF